ncbi:MAG: pitrilysin family protein [Candidatus Krumholzibacteria bacterium]|nr:pitrilysin family protein [Candidatus Krumholzibacteria bacterium]
MIRLPRPSRIVLDSGATLIHQRDPLAASCAFGAWITKGSRDEAPGERGMSHLLEHMVFRGTGSRSALDIALELESIGGHWDAFTGKEATCYHGRALEEHVPRLIEVLADIVLDPSLDSRALRTELQVVREEIRSVADSPEETTFEYFYRTVFGESRLGHPVAGTLGDIRGITRDRLARFHRRTYTAADTLFGFVGNIPPRRVASLIDRFFRLPPGAPEARRRGSRMPRSPASRVSRHRSWNQTHVCIGSRTVRADDPRRIVLLLLSNIIGGGVSSRMFQALRERAGLAYSVYSHVNFWRDTGDISVYFSVDPRTIDEALEIFHTELESLRRGGIRPEELDSARAQLKGAIVFGLESSEARLFRLLHNEIYHGGHRSVAEVLRLIERVNVPSVAEAARRFLAPDRLFYVTCGPVVRRPRAGRVRSRA